MKIEFPANQKTVSLKIPNILILNRFLFFVFKLIFVFKCPFIIKIKYKHIKPLVKAVKNQKNFEIVNIKTKNGEVVSIKI